MDAIPAASPNLRPVQHVLVAAWSPDVGSCQTEIANDSRRYGFHEMEPRFGAAQAGVLSPDLAKRLKGPALGNHRGGTITILKFAFRQTNLFVSTDTYDHASPVSKAAEMSALV